MSQVVSQRGVTHVTLPIAEKAITFKGLLDAHGYEWVTGDDSEPRLVARSGSHSMPTDSGLSFSAFARLRPTREDIQNFANRYGVLADSGVRGSARRPPGKYFVSQLQGMSFRQWKSEIDRMRALIDIWEAVNSARKDKLRAIIHWRGINVVSYRLPWSDTLLASPHYNKHLLKRFKRFDVVKPALYLLQSEINKRLCDYSSPSFLPVVPRLVWCPGPRVHGVVTWDHHQRLIFQPSNLLAAIWLQFAQAITQGYALEACSECGEPIQVGRGGKRKDTKTCGARCRQRRKRRLTSYTT